MDEFVKILPAVNASLNGLAGIFLVVGWVFIKLERKVQHGIAMGAAFVTSSIFLITYVAHKILVKGVHTPFAGTGTWKTVYYGMLISHIILAIAIVPMAIMTIRKALAADFVAHRALSRWTLPLWLYVSVTGVLVYFFLYIWFPGTASH